MLKNGTKVTIYEDPITRRIAEGQAEIIEHIQSLEHGLDRYIVHFGVDVPGFHVQRTILDENQQSHWVEPNDELVKVLLVTRKAGG